ncbi:MAG: hypothetical protein N3C12_01985 [Candidatus Binatia bacterium]|nr:hypothetical protein [Candidatus Binatia bacterium]
MTIDKIVTAVTIALGLSSVDLCNGVDQNRDRAVSIEEIISAVISALSGCERHAAGTTNESYLPAHPLRSAIKFS